MKKFNSQSPSIHWRINCFCNRRCPFCYGPENHHEVKLDESLSVIDNMLEHGINTFIITGGEPLLSKKIDYVLKYLKSNKAKTILYTNCDFFDLHEDVLTENLDVLCVPIDGGSEYSHDMVRGENNMRAVLSVLNRYAVPNSPFEIKVGTVIGRQNVNELEAMRYLLEKYTLSVWKIYEYIRYTDRTLQKEWQKLQLGISSEEYYYATQKLLQKQSKLNISISSQFDRNNSYFMMNPDLEIIIPTKNENGVFEDKVICSAKDTSVNDIEKIWANNVDWEKYIQNLNLSLF
ncbi:MAG: radical SAM protein [Bacteroidota bacterium]